MRLYESPNFENPVCNKSFYKADRVNITWNNQGTACLISTNTDVDKTGQSYYGETNLYFMALKDALSVHVQLGRHSPARSCTHHGRGIHAHPFCPGGFLFSQIKKGPSTTLTGVPKAMSLLLSTGLCPPRSCSLTNCVTKFLILVRAPAAQLSLARMAIFYVWLVLATSGRLPAFTFFGSIFPLCFFFSLPVMGTFF